MSARRTASRRATLRLTAVTALFAGIVPLLTAQEASACDVGYGYRPSVNINDMLHRRTCSTGTSLAGAAVVDALALAGVVGAGWVAYRLGDRDSGSPSKGQTAPGPALTAYLHAAGTASEAPGVSDEA
ncbi:hypothetical protein ACFC0M_00050 [Streptomyces sp. NPDC056149]|uniref:hypothetical protein n=1 Tax=unclassified Streptomyces TaxID=2593676 RepID=UPI0023818AF0|nr:hypothetical protein [Streptomyces sp. WZ-12]